MTFLISQGILHIKINNLYYGITGYFPRRELIKSRELSQVNIFIIKKYSS
jgi:hypothetical protein